ncbi:Reticulon-4 receptor [Chionoecetes opilio]|uniref:Reticulon-4 receptor n=1 Tax=Chionoecetes opilio TaxID=41210 RepID=A0A8J4XLJ3_CHIOP|nr:Reticulon-4 receptor [Chionoecetes opilio]
MFARVWLVAVLWCCILWKGYHVGAANTCPPAFLNRCNCGMEYSVYDGSTDMKYTVDCTNAGFQTVTMLQSLPSRTEVLIFTGNRIPTLPINVFNKTVFNQLETIDMSNNHIRFIQGKTFHGVSTVKTLILNHNDLEITDKKERPRLFSNFDQLMHLHLTNAFSEKINSTDYLLSLEDIFYESRLDFLRTLHLEQNEIWTIGNNTRVFCQLPKLEQLLLTDNRLRDFDFGIDCLHSLRYINLERNMITRLSGDAMRRLEDFTRTTSPVKIRMHQNIFVCDCRSKHFIEWLNTTHVDIDGWKDYKCVDGYPSSNIDKTLKEVVVQSDCGASVGNTKITDLVFADDAVIFAESLEVLVMALEALHEEAKPLGLEVSWLKTKVQVRELRCPSYGKSDSVGTMGPMSHGNHSHGYSSATIGALSFLLVFTSSMLLAVAYFHKQKLKSIFVPYWDFITRKIGYTGLSHDEAPQEVNV